MSENVRETGFVKINRKPEARIALCKCGESKKIYGVRMEKAQGGWNCTWAFPISADSAKREGYGCYHPERQSGTYGRIQWMSILRSKSICSL